MWPRVALADVKSSDIDLAAVEDLDDGEIRDMDYMTSLNVIFYEFIGSPGLITYIQCLGYLGMHSDGLKLSNRRFEYTAPSHVLIASGDLDRKSTRLNSSHLRASRMPSSA